MTLTEKLGPTGSYDLRLFLLLQNPWSCKTLAITLVHASSLSTPRRSLELQVGTYMPGYSVLFVPYCAIATSTFALERGFGTV